MARAQTVTRKCWILISVGNPGDVARTRLVRIHTYTPARPRVVRGGRGDGRTCALKASSSTTRPMLLRHRSDSTPHTTHQEQCVRDRTRPATKEALAPAALRRGDTHSSRWETPPAVARRARDRCSPRPPEHAGGGWQRLTGHRTALLPEECGNEVVVGCECVS